MPIAHGKGFFNYLWYVIHDSFDIFVFILLYSATSVYVERVFSKGRILLSHLRNRLSVQSTRALLCVGTWSRMGFVSDRDVRASVILPEVEEEESDKDVEEGWDKIPGV